MLPTHQESDAIGNSGTNYTTEPPPPPSRSEVLKSIGINVPRVRTHIVGSKRDYYYGGWKRRNNPTESISDLPQYSYKQSPKKPSRVFTTHPEEVEELLSCLKGPLGFDMEWTASFVANVPQRSVALIQICDANMILLIQVSSMKEFPPKLKEIIESPTCIKIGVNVSGDMRKLQRDYGLQGTGILELADAARCYDPDRKLEEKTLSNIVKVYLERELAKGPVRTSDWEQNPLTEMQMEYAASDAYCALEVYQRLRQIGDENDRLQDVMTLVKDLSIRAPAPAAPSTAAALARTKGPLTSSGGNWEFEPVRTGPTPQQQRAYHLWYTEKLELDCICRRLRSAENPLAKSTVITYVVDAIKADPALAYEWSALKDLLLLDYGSYKRHQRWLWAIHRAQSTTKETL